jgi:hypothetical protein
MKSLVRIFKQKDKHSGRPPIRSLCALLALLGLAVIAVAASKYTVTATMANGCCDANNNAFTLQSDGGGSYSNQGTVLSQLTPSNGSANYYQWSLDLTNSSRSFYLTLNPISGPDLFGSPSASLPFNGQVYSRCFTPSLALQNWTQIVTSDNNCAMRVNFTYQGVSYTLVMSPQYSGTGTATVTCMSNSSPCSAWTDVPTPGITSANVANLYNGSNLIGQYYLSFSITLTHP